MKQREKSKKNGFPWAAVVLVLGLLSQLTEGGGRRAFAGIVWLLVSCAGIPLVAFLIRIMNRSGNGAPARSVARPVAPPRQPSLSVRRAFPEPEAHCVVCENTGEDHFQRDKAQRLAQLDEWLKNGLIDKAEYRALKKKYQS